MYALVIIILNQYRHFNRVSHLLLGEYWTAVFHIQISTDVMWGCPYLYCSYMVVQYAATYGCSSYVFSQVGTTQVDKLDEDLERIAPSEVGVHLLCCVLTQDPHPN